MRYSEDVTLWYIQNNFNCICNDCLSDIHNVDLYQPAFKDIIQYGECELCGVSKCKGD